MLVGVGLACRVQRADAIYRVLIDCSSGLDWPCLMGSRSLESIRCADQFRSTRTKAG